MATPTSLTQTLDDYFLTTWYEIRPDAIDNILDATIFTMALKDFGCMTPQVGGTYITRTIRYGEKTSQNIAKGSVLTQSEPNLETMARWTWKYDASDVSRSMVDDQVNAGPSMIKSYIALRLGAARDALVQDGEQHLMRSTAQDSTGKQINGLYDIVAPVSATANGAYNSYNITTDAYNTSTESNKNGNLSRGETWWQNTYYTTSTMPTNYALNLVPVMRTLFNKCTNNLESPNFILMGRDLFEAYEDEVADKQQIVRTAFDQKAADLGFETFTFKGATVAWTGELASTTYREIFMLNMNYIELVYDPNYWFNMTEWKTTANQLERVAYIYRAWQLLTTQPRRHGYVHFTS